MRTLWFAAIGSLLGLIGVALAWELFLAPIKPGGSWLVLKAFPLLIPLRGMLHGRRYTFQWVPFLALAYFTEGVVRAWSEPAPVRTFALAQATLATTLFLAAIFFAKRAATPSRAED